MRPVLRSEEAVKYPHRSMFGPMCITPCKAGPNRTPRAQPSMKKMPRWDSAGKVPAELESTSKYLQGTAPPGGKD